MSITGRSQDLSTKPISWEALENPVPIGSFVSSGVSTSAKIPSRNNSELSESKEREGTTEKGLPEQEDEETKQDKGNESDQEIENTENNIQNGTHFFKDELKENTVDTSQYMLQTEENNHTDIEGSLVSLHTDRENTDDTVITSASFATYVSSQHKTDEFDLIANEFSLYAKQSRVQRREQIPENNLETEFSHPPPRYSQLSKPLEEQEVHEKEQVVAENTMANVLANELPSNEHGRAETVQETSRTNGRKQPRYTPKQTVHKTTTTKTVQIAKPKTDQTSKSNHHELINGHGYENPPIRQSFDTSVRPVPVGGDRSDVENVTRRSAHSEQPTVSVRSPNGLRPSPRPSDNGLTQSLILDLLSKGLGTFTKDMAELLVEQLKAEHEALANQVGLRVKTEAIEELSTLRKEVQELKEENGSLMASIEGLKIDNIKEREQIKREFEKDRLKRVNDVEEKNERISALEKENQTLQEQVKEKQRQTKIAEKKAKVFEDKLKKAEEEHNEKIKELHKELNKAKGELLVFRSKKRIKSSSTDNERPKTFLISRGGASAGRRGTKIPPLPPTIPYQEGDP
ncbi:centlein-like [Dreissena polymorpha]|uniref:Uncharacterized protein n=1 Tax=Dreissena polymorpha TaxID=45954 RepID=A0A9D4IJV6_DREPO|nr:centlein-like [Dreissena polymorpha]XP_052229691.1 centlein-like [Dreissena polymorpha]KAH3774318.1 hypothetical protein DPMN_175697 [Dreissena polymorpha]